MVNARQKKAIIKAYYDLETPGSYSGVNTFHHVVTDQLKIDISQRALRRILKSEKLYQVHYPSKSLWHRSNYSRGTNLEGYADVSFLRYGHDNDKQMVVLFVLDIFCRFLYAQLIPDGVVSPESMEKAYKSLFYQGLPKFPILRVDKDKSTLKLRPFFSKKKMLLQVLRGPHFMGILDTTTRIMKGKLSRFLFKYPHANLKKTLANACKSYNNTYNKKLGMSPAAAKNPLLDPELRKRLYPKENLLPFDVFLKKTLKLTRKTNTPRTKAEKVDTLDFKSWRVGDRCIINYKPHYLTRGYNVKRGPIKVIGKIYANYQPYVYRLKDTKGRWEPGYFRPEELTLIDRNGIKFIEEKVHHRFRRNKGRYKLVKFANHDE